MQTQARGAGRRDEWQRLMGGGGGENSGGRCNIPAEEVGSGVTDR